MTDAPTLLAPYRRLDNNSRYTLVYGGRGSAKSFHVAVYMLMQTFTPGEVILYTRYTMDSAKHSIIPEFQEKIDQYNMSAAFHTSGNVITNRFTGSKIIFSGIKTSSGNQTAKLKSITGLTFWVLDEAEEMPRFEEFDKIDDSIRKKGGSNRVMLVFNPTDVEHWIYKYFYQSGERAETTYIHTSYLDNLDNLDKSFIDKANALKLEDEQTYNHKYLGEWSSVVDAIFPRGYKTFSELPEGVTRTCLGGDFGFSDHPTAVVQLWLHRNNLYLKQVVYEVGLINESIAMAIPKKIRNEICIFDSSEKKSVIELRKYGVNAYPAKKGPNSVEFSIRKLQGLNVFIHKDSTDLQKEWTRYRWKKQNNGEYYRNPGGHKVPVKLEDDAIDAVRYGIMYLAQWE